MQNEAFYEQLVNKLRQQILEGQFTEGMRLPSEAQLGEQYNLSRGTVRQALEILTYEGLIERIKGSGSYVRQRAKLPMVSSKDRFVGLVVESQDQLNSQILYGVEQGAKSRGYRVVINYTDKDVEYQRRDILQLCESGIKGIIIFPVGKDAQQEGIISLQTDQIPFVLVDRYFPDLDTDYVVADNFGGGYQATEHLLILGYRRIVFAHNQVEWPLTSTQERWRGYRAALEHYRVTYDESLLFIAAPETGYTPLFLQKNPPDAVFAANDSEAIALLKTAEQQGKVVPKEIALVGFDDLSFSQHLNPPLTTISQPCMDIGLRAIHLLLDRIEGQTGAPKHISLPTRLIVRESCGAFLKVRMTSK